jgi:3D (Asp-Asp-Asp) domain-containing protein
MPLATARLVEHVMNGIYAFISLTGLLSLGGCAAQDPSTGTTYSTTATETASETGTEPTETGQKTVTTTETGTQTSTETGETAAPVPEVTPIAPRLNVRDYGYLFWPENHWTTWAVYNNIQHVQTGYYGLGFDVGTAAFSHIGPIMDEVPAEDALLQDNSVILGLPAADVTYGATVDGAAVTATGFFDVDGNTSNPSELINMGRYMQRIQIPTVSYDGANDLAGSIQLAAMTRHFVLSQTITQSTAATTITPSISLSGEALASLTEVTWLEGNRALSVHDKFGQGWSFIVPQEKGATAEIERTADGTLTFRAAFNDIAADEEVTLSVIAAPSNAANDDQLALWLNPGKAVSVEYSQLQRDGTGGKKLTPATWDAQRGLFLITLGDLSQVGAPSWPDWNDATQHNWYNRHRIVVHNNTGGPVSVPIAYEGGNNAAFYIVAGSPMLRDTNGEPTGIPIQISKNWHTTPYWYHLYSAMELDPGTHEFEHTFAHSKWGDAYAAAHSQLCLVGWGYNQQWDESSLGANSESITYDPDLTLARAQVDDVRPFLVDGGGKWGWTGNVGGASFLVYAPAEGYYSFEGHQLERMRTHYAYTGPNLTNVVYAGVSRDGKIASRVATQLGRTDDLVRAYYHLEYTFLEDVSYNRLALFQIAADRYADNGFSRYAYGNETEALFDAPINDHETTGYESNAVRGIEIPGESPWVMLYESTIDTDSLGEQLANIGFVIRDYEAEIGGVVSTQSHINIVQTYNNGYSQMAFELGVPYDEKSLTIPAGSTVRATVEYLVPPAQKYAYYGDSDYLLALDSTAYQSTEMMRTLASENHLEVNAIVGTVTRTHPVELAAEPTMTAVQFTLAGGLGYTPVTIHGLARPDGWHLQQNVKGKWVPLSQEVEGNDYWQAYDHVSDGHFDLIFNLHNRGENEYRLVQLAD